jgi:DNA-binding transcriptional ArsR family regulator
MLSISSNKVRQTKIKQVRKVLDALRQHPTDRGRTMVLCREVVLELPGQDWDTLRELESMIGALRVNLENEHRDDTAYLTGVLAALGETLATFELAARRVEERQLRQKLAKHHAALLEHLEEPRQPSDLAKTLNQRLSQVSRTLRQLHQAGLVEPSEPTEEQDGRSRLYVRTGLADLLLSTPAATSPVAVAALARTKQHALSH